MTRAEIYRKAAEDIAASPSGFCCNAIQRADNYSVNAYEAKDAFSIFKRKERDWGAWGHWWGGEDPDGRTTREGELRAMPCRVLALCFAAALAETGDL